MTNTPQHDGTDRAVDRLTDTEFAAKLRALVARACNDGVDLTGAYDVRTPRSDRSDVTVEISEIVERSE